MFSYLVYDMLSKCMLEHTAMYPWCDSDMYTVTCFSRVVCDKSLTGFLRHNFGMYFVKGLVYFVACARHVHCIRCYLRSNLNI